MQSLGARRKETIRRLFAMYSDGHWAEANQLYLTEDCAWEILPQSVYSRRTKADHAEYLRGVLADFSSFSISPSLVVHEDGVVFASCRSKAEHKLGGAYGQDYTFTFFFADCSAEKIREVREFVDSRYSMRFFEKVDKSKRARAAL